MRRKSIKNQCLPRWDLEAILVDFGMEHGCKLASKINEKPMSTSKNDFVKMHGFTIARINFFEFLGVEVGSKIDQTSIKT